jgi:hypothetical protein
VFAAKASNGFEVNCVGCVNADHFISLNTSSAAALAPVYQHLYVYLHTVQLNTHAHVSL